MRALRCGSAIFVRSAGNREVVRLWAQYFVHLGGVGVQTFAAGAGNREIASCGGAVTLGLACEGVWFGGAWNRKTAWQGCLMCALRWGFPLDLVSCEMLVLETWT